MEAKCIVRPVFIRRYAQSADIWAFGIIMLELATGMVPRKGMGFVSLVMQTVHGDVPSLADATTKRTYSKVISPSLLPPCRQPRVHILTNQGGLVQTY